jgi:hypothetical protein
MTTVITSIGSNNSIDTETPSSCSVVSGGWTVTFGTDPTGVSVGDICTIEDQSSMYSTFTYLVTAISGSDYTLKYISDTSGHGSTSPCNLYDMSYQQASATFKRAYSTITSWESQLDLTEYYSSGDDAVGECYKDSTFNENLTINGGGSVGLNSVKLTVAEADRHDGTENSGATIDYTGSSQSVIVVARDNVTIEWLEFDMSSGSSNSSNNRATTIDSSATTGIYFRNNLIYDLWGSFPIAVAIGSGGDSSNTRYFTNNIIYNVDDSDDRAKAFQVSSPHPTNFWNNTTYKIRTGRSSKDAYAYYSTNSTGMVIKNCVGYMGSSSGADYFSHNADSSSDYNATDESTATGGSNDITGISTTEFVSVTAGTEDLHVAEGAQCVGAGVDLGTTAGVNIDIDGFDRTTRTAWSIGAGDAVKPEEEDDGGGGGGGDSESEDRKLHRNPQRAASRSISNKLSNYRSRKRWFRNRGLSRRRHSAPEKYSSTKYSSKDKYGYNK